MHMHVREDFLDDKCVYIYALSTYAKLLRYSMRVKLTFLQLTLRLQVPSNANTFSGKK